MTAVNCSIGQQKTYDRLRQKFLALLLVCLDYRCSDICLIEKFKCLSQGLVSYCLIALLFSSEECPFFQIAIRLFFFLETAIRLFADQSFVYIIIYCT